MGCTSSAPPKTHYALVIGPAGAGKTTMSKQLSLIYGGARSDSELNWKQILLRNMILGLQEIPEFCKNGLLSYPKGAKKELSFFADLDGYKAEVTSEIAEKAKQLWGLIGEEYVQNVNTRDTEYASSLPYAVQHVFRLMDPATAATNDDIVFARQRTTGILRTTCTIDGKPWEVTDAGGQVAEQRKWVTQVQAAGESLDFIIFLAPLNEFDVPEDEEGPPKGIREAFDVWSKTLNGDMIPAKLPVVLFFNKVDLLQEKLKRDKVKKYFKDYKGENSANAVIEYFKGVFLSLVKDEARRNSVYIFSMTATDPNSVKNAWAAARQDAVSNAMADTGLTM